MKPLAVAYLITCLPTGKRYVGITTGSLSRRWSEHVSAARTGKYSAALIRAIRKYGPEAFAIEAVASCRTWDDLCATERALIVQWGTFAPGGYNLTLGGEGAHGCKHTPDQIERSAAKHRGRPCHPNTRAVSSAFHKGRPKSPETRRKMAAAAVGHPVSVETRRKLSVYWAARRADGDFKTKSAYSHRRQA